MPKKPKTPSPSPMPALEPPSEPPPPPAVSPPSTNTTMAPEDAEWHAKNARAKAIIMSTLIPGSEPWKIAEPLTLASDIWKALEDRYAPKASASSDASDGHGHSTAPASRATATATERSDFVSEWVDGKSLDKYRSGVRPGQVLTNFPADALMPEYNLSLSAEEREAARRLRREQEPQSQPLPLPPRQTVPGHTTSQTSGDADAEAPIASVTSEDAERRRKEAQRAAARVLQEHMPNRDQRFLWALLHGGKEETMAWFNGTAAG